MSMRRTQENTISQAYSRQYVCEARR